MPFQQTAQNGSLFFIGFAQTIPGRRIRLIHPDIGVGAMAVTGLPGCFTRRHNAYVPFKLILTFQFKITVSQWMVDALPLKNLHIDASISITWLSSK